MSAPVNQRGSILWRLVGVLSFGALALGLLIFFLLRVFSAQVIQESQDRIIAASASAILESARGVGGALDLYIPYSAFTMLGTLSDERVFYAVHQGEQFVTGYEDLPFDPTPSAQARFVTLNYRGEEIRIASLSRSVIIGAQAHQVTVSVAQTLSGQRQLLARMSLRAAMVGVISAVLLGALGYAVSSMAVEPINRLTQSVARRGPNELRSVAAPVPREMVPLVVALNRFMERLKRSLTRSEDLITEAAHRVRTPLATVRSQAEMALRRTEDDESRGRLRMMIRAIDESSRAAGQILDHAMVSFRTDHLEREAVDLSALLADILARQAPMAMLRDIQFQFVPHGPAIVKGDAILIQNALVNVIDNAVKYSPEETKVTIEIAQNAGETHVYVRDQGAGFDLGQRDHLMTRFARGTNTQGVIGSGLGLTIVQDVLEAHGGRIELSNSEGGGACVMVCFVRS